MNFWLLSKPNPVIKANGFMIKEWLLKEHSKRNTQLIVAYVGNNSYRLKELLKIFSEGDKRLSKRAAWPLSYIAELHPALVKPHLRFIIRLLENSPHDAIKRNVLRLLQYIKIPNSLIGKIADYCFAYLKSEAEPVAIRVFAMQVLANLCLTYPELKQELIPLIEDMMPYGSAGIKSRGKKILIELNSPSD